MPKLIEGIKFTDGIDANLKQAAARPETFPRVQLMIREVWESITMGNEHWQLAGSAAELYQRYLVLPITTKWAEDLVERARPCGGEAVLDVACGTGVVARLAAKARAKVRPRPQPKYARCCT